MNIKSAAHMCVYIYISNCIEMYKSGLLSQFIETTVQYPHKRLLPHTTPKE